MYTERKQHMWWKLVLYQYSGTNQLIFSYYSQQFFAIVQLSIILDKDNWNILYKYYADTQKVALTLPNFFRGYGKLS